MVKAQITNNYCWLTLYTQKPEETVRIIVMMWFVNGIPFTFEELPQAVQEMHEVVVEADVFSLEYTDIDLYHWSCLLYTSPSPRDRTRSRMPSSA